VARVDVTELGQVLEQIPERSPDLERVMMLLRSAAEAATSSVPRLFDRELVRLYQPRGRRAFAREFLRLRQTAAKATA
jgi:hypothetical protein